MYVVAGRSLLQGWTVDASGDMISFGLESDSAKLPTDNSLSSSVIARDSFDGLQRVNRIIGCLCWGEGMVINQTRDLSLPRGPCL